MITVGNTWNYLIVCEQMIDIKQYYYCNNTLNHLTSCKHMIDIELNYYS